jgi:hypothetical protein
MRTIALAFVNTVAFPLPDRSLTPTIWYAYPATPLCRSSQSSHETLHTNDNRATGHRCVGVPAL